MRTTVANSSLLPVASTCPALSLEPGLPGYADPVGNQRSQRIGVPVLPRGYFPLLVKYLRLNSV